MANARGLAALLVASLLSSHAGAIDLVIDYSYDEPAGGGSYFFPPGSEARAALDAAAGYYSGILDDTFSEVTTPEPYYSDVFDGVCTWQWTQSFNNPATGQPVTLYDPTAPEDTYVIYAGARNLPGSTLGFGGPGGRGYSRTPSGGWTQQEIDELEAISDAFISTVETRGEATGFANWGGAITFDSGNDNWHFDHTTAPSFSENDFYSVALHELGHALGLGTADEWEELVYGSGSSAYFDGTAASAEHGGDVPLAYDTIGGVHYADTGHWRENTMSTVFGSSTPQEAAMDPSTTNGTRVLFTALDAAGLSDIGWTVVEPEGLSGDANEDGVVDALDYVAWRDSGGSAEAYAEWRANYGATLAPTTGVAAPEPASFALALFALAFATRAARRRVIA